MARGLWVSLFGVLACSGEQDGRGPAPPMAAGGQLPSSAAASGGGTAPTAGAGGSTAAGQGGAAGDGGAAGHGGTPGGAGSGGCTNEAPSESLLLWLRAGDGVVVEGGRVATWANAVGGAPAVQADATRQPELVDAALNGHPALRFDDDDVLQLELPVDGRPALSIAFVNRTPLLWKSDPGEWCGRAMETGCSGTYQPVLWWNGTGDWGGVYLSPKQEEISFRFGNGQKTYMGGPELEWDPWVAHRRPASIADGFSRTIVVHGPATNRLYVAGELVQETPVTAGDPTIANTADRLDIGNGLGWIEAHNQGGEIAELLVYGAALAEPGVAALDQYLACRFFPP